MVVPEFRWPTTPLTLLSTSFCATAVPCFGSAASSSASSSNLAFLSPIFTPLAFRSSMAILAPSSLSLPRWAMAPLVGPTWPILTTIGQREVRRRAPLQWVPASCGSGGFFLLAASH